MITQTTFLPDDVAARIPTPDTDPTPRNRWRPTEVPAELLWHPHYPGQVAFRFHSDGFGTAIDTDVLETLRTQSQTIVHAGHAADEFGEPVSHFAGDTLQEICYVDRNATRRYLYLIERPSIDHVVGQWWVSTTRYTAIGGATLVQTCHDQCCEHFHHERQAKP